MTTSNPLDNSIQITKAHAWKLCEAIGRPAPYKGYLIQIDDKRRVIYAPNGNYYLQTLEKALPFKVIVTWGGGGAEYVESEDFASYESALKHAKEEILWEGTIKAAIYHNEALLTNL